jgi:hypothetical protein
MPRPRVIIAAQNTRYSQPLPCGAQTGVISISGHWFLQVGAPKTPDLAAFIGTKPAAVEARLARYLDKHPEVSAETTEVLMMDVEKPHPKDLHGYAKAEQRDIVRAYKRRIAALRKTFPNARLCMYGTLNPDGRGRADNATYVARRDALKEAGKRGLYDRLQYLVPVLYPRFGPNDHVGAWTSYRAYTELGIDGSRELIKSDQRGLPLLPVTGFRVSNGNSAHNCELLLDLPVNDPLQPTLRTQLDVIAEKGVQDVVLWVGMDADLIREPNPDNRTVTDHVCGL